MKASRSAPPYRRDLIKVRPSRLHGRGLFASQAIKKGTLIGTYEGKPTRRDGPHVLWISSSKGIDGTNLLRYVNHSRRPNAVFEGDKLYAIKQIPAGAEITHHYGESWED